MPLNTPPATARRPSPAECPKTPSTHTYRLLVLKDQAGSGMPREKHRQRGAIIQRIRGPSTVPLALRLLAMVARDPPATMRTVPITPAARSTPSPHCRTPTP